jgi:glycosyltransferase involved in cell wall biosynthesis
MLSGDLKWGAFRCAELFCLPSHQENFAIVIAEALACALPVALATPVNLSETIAVAHAGLVHSDTLAGTSDALHTWLTLSQEEKTQMGVRGELLFKDKFDISSVALNLQSILMSSIHARHPRLLP